MPVRPAVIILASLLLGACSTTPAPSGPMSVIISNPFNTLTGGVIEAPVQPDGSFANGMRQGNSNVGLSGQVSPEKRGAYEVIFNYQCSIARALNAIDAKSLQATVITRPNDPQPVGELMIQRDGSRHPGAADDISFELRILPLTTEPHE